ncbi:MAG TPA: AMP-binding protein [Rhodanobacter sp.]|nr:AMP-binding protein [Rhodanobacter sp.]
MRRILQRVADHARRRGTQTALVDDRTELDYATLQQAIVTVADALDGKRVALLLDNCCAWAVVDLALAQREAVCVPIPLFFTDDQLLHLIGDADPDLVVSDQPARLQALTGRAAASQLEVAGRTLFLFRRSSRDASELPPDTCKITYTSGTTGQPKGVCLSGHAIAQVTLALSHAADAGATDRSLSLLPLSTLLENIGGVYAPLLSGSRAALPSLATCGFSGSSSVKPDLLIAALHRYAPTATILVPQLLKLLVESVSAGARLPGTLRFMAVGGAPCTAALIGRARNLGFPVYEGYGLSEAASVVSLNRPGGDRVGSVGRPLPHVRVRIADDGEIMVAGELFGGYLGSEPFTRIEWPTGDLGRFDADGYLHVVGRKKTAFATAFGRNVAPEWVEGELTSSAAIMQAAVFGEGRASNVAVIVPHPAADRSLIDHAVAAANARLPDYARVRAWCPAEAAFSAANGLARGSGSLDREAIARHYTTALEALHAAHAHPVDL